MKWIKNILLGIGLITVIWNVGLWIYEDVILKRTKSDKYIYKHVQRIEKWGDTIKEYGYPTSNCSRGGNTHNSPPSALSLRDISIQKLIYSPKFGVTGIFRSNSKEGIIAEVVLKIDFEDFYILHKDGEWCHVTWFYKKDDVPLGKAYDFFDKK